MQIFLDMRMASGYTTIIMRYRESLSGEGGRERGTQVRTLGGLTPARPASRNRGGEQSPLQKGGKMKTLEIGKNYSFAFGMPADREITYLGGESFRLVNGTATREVQSPDLCAKIKAYIQPAINAGPLG